MTGDENGREPESGPLTNNNSEVVSIATSESKHGLANIPPAAAALAGHSWRTTR